MISAADYSSQTWRNLSPQALVGTNNPSDLMIFSAAGWEFLAWELNQSSFQPAAVPSDNTAHSDGCISR